MYFANQMKPAAGQFTFPQFPYHFMIITAILLFTFPVSYCGEDTWFIKCNSSFKCGELRIRYPFRDINQPKYCGRQEFEIECHQNSYATLYIGPLNFRVLNINRTEQMMRLARMDLWNTTCPADEAFVNISLTYKHFNYGRKVRNLSLFYGCPPPGSSVLENNFTRTTDSFGLENNVAYFVDESFMGTRNLHLEECSVNIVVPILEEARDKLFQGNIRLEEAFNNGFDVEFEADQKPCDLCESSGGICGSNFTSNQFLCLCHDQPHAVSCKASSDGNVKDLNPFVRHTNNSAKKRLSAYIPLIIAGTILTCAIIFCYIMILSKKKTKCLKKIMTTDKNFETFINLFVSLAPKRYSRWDVKKITDSFKEKLGEGGYGCVYKGKLQDGRIVAVKVLNKSKGCAEDFINEVASISTTSHVNIVSLLGFCFEGTKRALIFEFMPNGSLEKFIYGEDTSKPAGQHLGWDKLYQIAVGIARGLEYLHRGCNTQIVHFDIKPHNILLDEDFCPKISDFGLAKLCPKKKSTITMMDARGTIGYIAPEVFSRSFGGVSHKSDVYSYGMMVLEMVGGRKNADLHAGCSSEIFYPHWVYKRLNLGNDHLGLRGVLTEHDNEIARKMILVGLWCIQTNPLHRPCINEVLLMLEGNIESLQIPPKPFVYSPPVSPIDLCTTTTTL